MKIGVCGGHYKGHNTIPAPWKYQKPAYKSYAEGTVMHDVALAVSRAEPKIFNARYENGYSGPTGQVPSFGARASRLKKAGCTHAVELHSNWSMHTRTTPNRGVMVVIVSLCYEDGSRRAVRAAEEIALARKMWKPLADRMGLRFEIRTKKGGGNWDYYSFINQCRKQGIPHPQILELGYHMDMADDVPGHTAQIVQRCKELQVELSAPVAPPIVQPPVAPPPALTTDEHVFAEGETLWSIGRAHGVDWETIKRKDGKPIESGNMHIGDVLLIPKK
jgi:hypothetical protein